VVAALEGVHPGIGGGSQSELVDGRWCYDTAWVVLRGRDDVEHQVPVEEAFVVVGTGLLGRGTKDGLGVVGGGVEDDEVVVGKRGWGRGRCWRYCLHVEGEQNKWRRHREFSGRLGRCSRRWRIRLDSWCKRSTRGGREGRSGSGINCCAAARSANSEVTSACSGEDGDESREDILPHRSRGRTRSGQPLKSQRVRSSLEPGASGTSNSLFTLTREKAPFS